MMTRRDRSFADARPNAVRHRLQAEPVFVAGEDLDRPLGMLEVTDWFGMAIDVTERKRAEEALREADRRKDEFLAMLAHEPRNPPRPR
jgi:PAS domain-containing protein